ncbi:carbon storage regulator CsrA [Cohnella thailandensis]|uniref:Translational regulator CsrA n=1 Tax=Cohnella thailandensis TaxID=557557 RepID=A0A841SP72_9BACL|nr:carbon storage regulator CsrA [Cohnella thailandensis]MBB6632589.1 carbon storage regulator CsrA [Cohnella thailandensis]MBP1971883.1 carbon storage regulator [Cohnella thailandensis]
MLVLTRKKGQSILIQDDIEITILGIYNDHIKLGISAPPHVQIVRSELMVSIRETNKEASELPHNAGELAEALRMLGIQQTKSES